MKQTNTQTKLVIFAFWVLTLTASIFLGYKIGQIYLELDKQIKTALDPALISCQLNYSPYFPEAKPTRRPKSAFYKKDDTKVGQKVQKYAHKSEWIGKVSTYSRKGCLGCSKTLTMANGEPLDDNRLTIAFNRLPLNTQVKITNLDTGASVIATVTDRGGFERHGRIADLTIATATAIGAKTDTSTIKIEPLK